MKKIYIAGKMRDIPYYNFPKFFEAEAILERDYWEVINPARLDMSVGINVLNMADDSDWTKEPEGVSIKSIAERDISYLLECDAIYLLDSWKYSKGARAEKAIAEWLELEIIYENPER